MLCWLSCLGDNFGYLSWKVDQEKLLQYIHFNRHYNTLLVQHNTKLIKELIEEKADNSLLIQENMKQIEQLRKNNALLIQSNAKEIDHVKSSLMQVLPGTNLNK